MIYKVIGIVEAKEENAIIINTNSGICYFINSTNALISKYNIGDKASIYTELIVREDSWNLYGFCSISEKNIFKLLNSVQGVAAKSAIAILSKLTEEEIYSAINNSDTQILSSVNGIGNKIAARIINELKGKIPYIITRNVSNKVYDEVLSALLNLGFKKQTAVETLLSTKDSLDKVDDDITFEKLLRETLKRIKK